LIDKRDGQPFSEIRHLPKTLRQRVEVIVERGENGAVGEKRDRRAIALGGIANALDRRLRHTRAILLAVNAAVLTHLDAEPLAPRVDYARADAVQARGHLVAAATELSARVEHGENDFKRRLLELRLDVDGDASAVIGHRDRAVGVDDDLDPIAESRQRLVDRV